VIDGKKIKLGILEEQIKDSSKQLLNGNKKNRDINSETRALKKKFEIEEVKLDKMTKMRIRVGQERQVLNQVKEEIKAAYERAGMKYPYGE